MLLYISTRLLQARSALVTQGVLRRKEGGNKPPIRVGVKGRGLWLNAGLRGEALRCPTNRQVA